VSAVNSSMIGRMASCANACTAYTIVFSSSLADPLPQAARAGPNAAVPTPRADSRRKSRRLIGRDMRGTSSLERHSRNQHGVGVRGAFTGTDNHVGTTAERLEFFVVDGAGREIGAQPLQSRVGG